MCNKCGGETQGYKCAICGLEDKEYNTHHIHIKGNVILGSNEKCKSCGEADINCICRQVIFHNYWRELEYTYQFYRAGWYWWWD